MKQKGNIVTRIIIILIVLFFLSIFYNEYENKKMEVSYKENIESMPITYMVMDEKTTPNNVTIEEINNKYNDSMLFFMPGILLELYEDGEYYTGKLSDLDINKNIIDYAFTKNNLNGEIIDDCIFDKTKNIIKIPKKYYKKGLKKAPVQMEIVSKNNKKNIQNHDIDIEINGRIKKHKKITISGYDTSTIISILKYKSGKSILKEDISIYLNDSKYKLTDRLYDYNSEGGTIELGIPPLSIKKVRINIKRKSFADNILTSVDAKSSKYAKMNAAGELAGAPAGLSVGSTFKITKAKVAYLAGDGKLYGNEWTRNHWSAIEEDALYYNCDKTKGTCASYSSGQDYFAVHLNRGTISNLPQNASISFATGTVVKMFCAGHTTPADATADPDVWFKVEVLAIGSNYIVLEFTTTDNFFSQKPAGTLKFTWDQSLGRIKLKKYLYGNGSRDQGESKHNFGFTLYNNLGECNAGPVNSDDDDPDAVVPEKFTNDDSNINWKKLTFGDYYVKETHCDTSKYICDTSCHKVVLDENDAVRDADNNIVEYADESTLYYTRSNGAYLMPSSPVINYKRYVCFSVTKSSSISGSDVSNITFTSSTGDVKTTSATSPTVTFGPYIMGPTYKYKETVTNSTHFNDNAEFKDAAVSEATYTFGGYTSVCTVLNNTGCLSYDTTVNYVPTCSSGAANSAPDTHKKWCLKVKKIDKATQQTITDDYATFQLCADANCNTVLATQNTSAGIATFMGLTHDGTSNTGGSSYYVKETKAPKGYAIAAKTPVEISSSAVSELAEADTDSTDASKCGSTPFVFEDSKLLINWFKENDKNDSGSTKRADGAKFKVKDPSGKYIKYEGTESVTDDAGTTKTCYKYKESVDSADSASVFISGDNGDKGGVCISGLDDGEYTVIETLPTANHTFGSSLELKIDASTTFNTDKIFTNYPTYVEIEKKVTDSERVSNSLDDSVLKKIETNKLKKIPFEVYKADANGAATGDPISFVEIDGVYHDASSVDVTSETQTTTLYLNDERKIKLSHLSWGTGTQQYVLKEKGHVTSDACTCTTDPDCIGYYYPKSDQEVKFTITKCSSSSSVDNTTANTTVGTGTCPNTYVAKVGDQDNTPTELWFTKKDFYSYENSEDIADSVNFENDKERSDFDRIHFKVKDSNGNYLKFVDIGSHITDSDKKCLKDDDYHEYRYITDAELNLLTEEERNQLTIVEELQTCGGHIRITNLCRGKSFTVEEVSVPEDSVFVLEKDSDGKNPQVTYTVPCCDNDTVTNKTTTTIIKDKGTRVRFEKRDSKYNYLIPDETTTFQVYQCEKGVECHPTDNVSNMAGATGVRKIMKFKDKEYLTAEDLATPLDQEDGKDNGSVIQHTDQLVNGDTDYESKYKVYKAVSDSDLSNNETYVTDLNPDKGILILRYLPAGYNYVLVETVSPKGYMLPDGRRRETSFTITKETVKVEEVNVPNKPVSLLVRKYDNKGNLLEGAEFTMSKAKNCNMNVAPNKVEREDALTLKTIRDGVYEVRPTGDTTKFKTCQDRPGALCNDINGTLTHQLYTTETYGNSMGDFSQLLNDRSEPVVIEAGEALIQYLNYGACYIIEETKAPDGFSLPENEEDRFVMVKMTDKEQVVDTYDQLVNKPTPFTFYKYDEYNNLLDGGKYKLQKLNQDKIYKDVPVTEEEEDGTIYYKVDPNSQNYLMETKNGTATVYYLDEGQYRILEVEAPPGYELPIKTINVATFFVDKDGKTYGSNIIANKPKTEVKEIKPSASAKLVVDIKTGQKVIRYGLIITVMILAISGLMYFSRKNKEENDNNEKK